MVETAERINTTKKVEEVKNSSEYIHHKPLAMVHEFHITGQINNNDISEVDGDFIRWNTP